MITRYKKYIAVVDKNLKEMFEKQSSFIKCKKGCAFCCKEGEFPMSELEYVDMMLKYTNLDNELKEKIDANINKLIETSKSKIYECPFLIDNVCSVYDSRSIICRTFGLISYYKKERCKIPFCVNLDLNYAEVYDKDTEQIVMNAQDGTVATVFNVDRRTLRSKKVEQKYHILFGEDKPLIEWLREDFKVEND